MLPLAYTYTSGRITAHPATSPDSGADRRVRVTDNFGYQFHRSVSTGGQQPQTLVEVQSLRPDGYGRTVVALVTFVSEGENNLAGQADVMCSPAEARAIAESLILAAAEAEAIDQLAAWAGVTA